MIEEYKKNRSEEKEEINMNGCCNNLERQLKFPRSWIKNWDGRKVKDTLLNTEEYQYNAETLASLIWIQTEGGYNYFREVYSFSLEDLIKGMNLTPIRGTGKSLDRFRIALMNLQDEGIIYDCTTDLATVKQKELIKCKININYDQEEEKDSNWFRIAYTDVLQILDKVKSKSICEDICALVIIRAWQYQDNDNGYFTGTPRDYNTLQTTDTRPECARMTWAILHPHVKKVFNSRGSWDRAVGELESIGLVHTKVSKNFVNEYNPKIYGFNELEVKWASRFYNKEEEE